MATLTTGTEIGGYRIEGFLGRGGMGIVYEAVQLSLGRTVALKLLGAEVSEDDSFRARFKREARLHAGIEHAHIVPIYEAGLLDDEVLFIAMRLIRGATLKELIRGGGLDGARSIKLLTPVADALDTAHEADLVHRDIKPQNILVGRRDHAYLADFGLTRAPGDTAFTRTGAFVGTLDYIAPEQIRGEEASARSDLYSMAAVAFECLTGSVLFRKPNEASILFAHMAEEPPRASTLRPEIPRAVDEVFARALAKNPAERHASALDLMVALTEALQSAPLPAPGVPPGAVMSAGDSTEEVLPPPPPPPPIAADESTVVTPGPAPAAPEPEPEPAGETTEIVERPPPPEPEPEPEPLAEPELETAAEPEPTVEETGESTEIVDRPPVPDAEPEPPEEPAAEAAETLDPPAPAESPEHADHPAPTGDHTEQLSRPGAGAATLTDRRRGAAAAPRPAGARTRRRLPPRAGRVLASAALLAAAVAGGLALGGSGGGSENDGNGAGATPAPATQAPETVAMSAAGLSADAPAGWAEADETPELPGAEHSSAAVPEDGDDARAMTVASLAGAGPTLLPDSLLERIDGTPEPAATVDLGDAKAYRYDDLAVEGVDSPMTIYVAPMKRNVAAVACLGGDAVAEDCARTARSLTFGAGRTPVRLGPGDAYAKPMRKALDDLRSTRRTRREDLAGAGSSAQQAQFAGRLEDAYDGFSKRAGKIATTPLEADAHAAIRKAAGKASKTYGKLAKTARQEREQAYGSARDAAASAEKRFDDRVRALRRLGYRVD